MQHCSIYYWQKAAYKRTHTVQTHVVQESAVLHALPMSILFISQQINNYSEMYVFLFFFSMLY